MAASAKELQLGVFWGVFRFLSTTHTRKHTQTKYIHDLHEPGVWCFTSVYLHTHIYIYMSGHTHLTNHNYFVLMAGGRGPEYEICPTGAPCREIKMGQVLGSLVCLYEGHIFDTLVLLHLANNISGTTVDKS